MWYNTRWKPNEMDSHSPLSLSLIIVFFPLILEVFRFVLDQLGLAGEGLIKQLVEADQRTIVKNHLKDPTDGEKLLQAVEGLFRFGEKANFIIRAHIAFLISLYFASVEKTKSFSEIKGWPLFVLVVVMVSLLLFLFRLYNVRRLRAGGKYQLPFWQTWNGLLWVSIIFGEAYDHLSHA